MPDAAPKLSIITTCKGRLGHLQQTLPAMAIQPGVEVVVVDYDCPEGAADWVKQHHPSVRTVRVEKRPTFNISHARNLGAAASSGDWLCFMDADIAPVRGFCRHVVDRLEPSRFYTIFPFAPEMYGTCILPREAFFRVGGYDEVFEPWSYEDKDLYVRLQELGLVQDQYPAALLTAISHDDAARMRFSGSVDRWETMRRNALYHHAKLLATRAVGSPLDEGSRRQLYAEIKRAMTGAPDRCEITIQLPVIPSGAVAPGRRIEARIVVALQREPGPG